MSKASGRRQAVIDRVAKLMRMTAERGASEAEAARALEMATRLMTEHDLTERDVEMSQSEYDGHLHKFPGMRLQRKGSHPVRWVGAGVELLAGVRLAYGYDFIIVVGRPHEVEIACYMMDMLRRSIDQAWKDQRDRNKARIKAEPWPEVRSAMVKTLLSAKARTSFKTGAALRLAQRVVDLAESRKSAQRASGNALVVVQDGMLEEALNRILPNAPIEKSDFTPDVEPTSFRQGMAAGDDILLTEGLAKGKNASGLA